MALFTFGWVIPLGFAGTIMINYLHAEVLPRARGQNPINSFPFIATAKDALALSCFWLAAVAIFWIGRRLQTSRAKKPTS
jgi:hypothetical protein